MAPPKSGPGSPTDEGEMRAPAKITFARQSSFNRATDLKANLSDVTDFQVHEVDARAVLPTAAPSMQLLMGGNDYRRLQTPPESKFSGHHSGFAVPVPLGKRGAKVSRGSTLESLESASRSGASSPADALRRMAASPVGALRSLQASPFPVARSGQQSPVRALERENSSLSSLGQPCTLLPTP